MDQRGNRRKDEDRGKSLKSKISSASIIERKTEEVGCVSAAGKGGQIKRGGEKRGGRELQVGITLQRKPD